MTNTVYVLFAKIVSTAQLHEKLSESHALRIIASIQRQMVATAETYNGGVAKSAGEEFMCHFSGLSDALNGAAAIMRAVESASFPDAWQFRIKMGLCCSEEILLFDDWAQLANLARPHQILITSEVRKRLPASSPFNVSELPAVRINVYSSPVWEFRWRESAGLDASAQTAGGDPAHKTFPILIIQFNGLKWILQREGDTISIGREKTNDIVIREDVVSRHHLHIKLRNGKAVLSDQSTNGTYIFPDFGKSVLLMRDQAVLTGNGRISFQYTDGDMSGSVFEYSVLLEQ
jgi:adenylate cyclase